MPNATQCDSSTYVPEQPWDSAEGVNMGSGLWLASLPIPLGTSHLCPVRSLLATPIKAEPAPRGRSAGRRMTQDSRAYRALLRG